MHNYLTVNDWIYPEYYLQSNMGYS